MKLLSGVKTGGAIVLTVLVNLALIPVVMFPCSRLEHLLERLDGGPLRWRPKVPRRAESTACRRIPAGSSS